MSELAGVSDETASVAYRRLYAIAQKNDDFSGMEDIIGKAEERLRGSEMILEDLWMRIEQGENRKKPIEAFFEQLKQITEQAKRAMRVVETIHQLPKEAQEKMESIKLDELIEKSRELARFQTYWENLGDTPIDKTLHPDLPLIRGNMVHLEGVFLNLIINSYQAMQHLPSEERRIFIEARIAPYKSKFIEIRFCDTGGGIPEEDLSKVFEHRYSTKEKGHGMGLFVCKYFVEKVHGGTIGVENVPGKGACFIMELPIWEEEEA